METTKWISVKDRLPEDDGEVLIYHSVWALRLIGYCGEVTTYDERVWQDSDDYFTKGEITHWQPLPEPPEIDF